MCNTTKREDYLFSLDKYLSFWCCPLAASNYNLIILIFSFGTIPEIDLKRSKEVSVHPRSSYFLQRYESVLSAPRKGFAISC